MVTVIALRRLLDRVLDRVRFGVDPRSCPTGTWVVLPRRGGITLACGIAALVEVADGSGEPETVDVEAAAADVDAVVAACLTPALDGSVPPADYRDRFAGGPEVIGRLTEWARGLKRRGVFPTLLGDADLRDRAAALAARLREFADAEDHRIELGVSAFAEADVEVFASRLLAVRDVAWHVDHEALGLVEDVRDLCGESAPGPALLRALRGVAGVLRSVDRIEIRGRDSAGLAVQVSLPGPGPADAFLSTVADAGLADDLAARTNMPDLPALSVLLADGPAGDGGTVVTFIYKVAAEVGRLGDNVAELRRQIRGDRALHLALAAEGAHAVVLGHTRWASSGVISLPNCHPVDNGAYADPAAAAGAPEHRAGHVLVVMNGDVDNHLALREEYEATGRAVPPRITTDTKMVALEIERHLVEGCDLDEAFRRACSRFEGSCAVGVVSDLAPGRVLLSLRGSGQSLYVGVGQDGWFASSEVYGLVEETGAYVKLGGETDRVEGHSGTRGQIAVLDGAAPRGREGLCRLSFDGTAMPVTDTDVLLAEITTRDVDRGGFEHYFRKEVTQAARSVERTLWGRVSTTHEGGKRRHLAESVLSPRIRELVESGDLRRIYVVGQGTAAVAGAGIAAYLRDVLAAAPVLVEPHPATELSGFLLDEEMTGTLVVAVTQSGSTADTNRAVDLARRRGAAVVAVVNRRNSDITYRTDGVVYTSDGRDVEMSVASTKAFYAQIVAGALLGLAIGRGLGVVDDDELHDRLDELVRLPARMRQVIEDEGPIRRAAEELAPTREHWAIVGSGPNRVAASEVRIKLSELCYKSIALDTVEDKKHIDLSSEPLILLLAAGNPEPVLNDLVKDAAIFKAHKALPVVFCARGETRFDPYASAVVALPEAPPLSSMILCAVAGHLFGYHAARAIDGNARFLSGLRSTVVGSIADVALEESLPATLAPLREEFLERLHGKRFASALTADLAVRVSQLLDHLTGVTVFVRGDLARLGAADGNARAALVRALAAAIDQCARPVDAIKHQAKIVTVGTSRPEERMTGILADALTAAGVDLEAVAPVDALSLRRLQAAVATVDGFTRYAVSALRVDGSPGPGAMIRVTDRGGVATGLRSRAENGAPLSGTKRQVVVERRLFLGVGRGDGRRIAILPVLDRDRHVTGLLLLHLTFREELTRREKIRVLGRRIEQVRNLVAEADREFDEAMLDRLTPEQVAMEKAETLAERILEGSH